MPPKDAGIIREAVDDIRGRLIALLRGKYKVNVVKGKDMTGTLEVHANFVPARTKVSRAAGSTDNQPIHEDERYSITRVNFTPDDTRTRRFYNLYLNGNDIPLSGNPGGVAYELSYADKLLLESIFLEENCGNHIKIEARTTVRVKEIKTGDSRGKFPKPILTLGVNLEDLPT